MQIHICLPIDIVPTTQLIKFNILEKESFAIYVNMLVPSYLFLYNMSSRKSRITCYTI